jgi:hypothetical protein
VNTFALDPGVFSIQKGSPRPRLLAQLKLIFQLEQASHDRFLNLLLPRQVIRILQRADVYPSHDHIAAELARTGLRDVYSVTDVCSKIDALLQFSELEACLEIEEAVWTDFVGTPSATTIHSSLVLIEVLERILVFIAFAQKINGASPSLISLFQEIQVEVSAIIHMIEPDSKNSLLPLVLNESIQHLVNVDSALDAIDPLQIWQRATDSKDIKLAIILAARKMLMEDGKSVTLANMPKFLIGSEFVNSLKNWQAFQLGEHSSVVLQKCAAICINRANVAINEFREDKNKHSSTVFRKVDRAKAFRTHIGGSGLGLRLMLWENSDGVYEFANVGSKNELVIEYGIASKAI